MTRPRLLLAASIFLAAGLVAVPAGATLLRRFSLGDLVRRSDVIAVVHVEGSRSLRAGKHNFIYTDYRLRVDEVWHAGAKVEKLQAGAELTLRQIGGRVGDHEQSVVGTAEIRAGDHLVVFARHDGERAYLAGMLQGARFLRPGAQGFRVFPSRTAAEARDPAAGLDYARFREQVATLLGEAGK